nr:response regulator transcription factor [Anaerolineae bacterium]
SVQADIEVVGEAINGEQALQKMAQALPDVVLMDIEMPILDGVATTRHIKQHYPTCQVIILTTFDNDDYVFEGLRAGALGYLLKDAPAESLMNAIRIAARGESFLQPSIAKKVVSEFSRLAEIARHHQSNLADPLTERELDILRLIIRGMTNMQIANHLFITEGTVKNHVTAILNKLGVKDRQQATQRARELRLL